MPPQDYRGSGLATGSFAARPSLPVAQIAPAEAPEAPSPFWSAVTRATRRSAEDQWRNRTPGWRETEWHGRLMERHLEIERRTGRRLSYSFEMNSWETGPEASREGLAGLSRGLDDLVDAPARAVSRALGGDVSIAEYEARLDRLKAEFPELADIPTRDALFAAHDAELRGVRARAEAAAGDGVGGAVGGFVGGAGAALADPVNVGAAVLTGGLGAGRPLLTRMGAQALAGVGIEATQVPQRALEADQFAGPDYGAAEAGLDVLFAGAGAAGFEAVGAGARSGWRAVRGRVRAEAATADDPLLRGLDTAMDRLELDEAAIGAADDFDGARAALATGRPRPAVEPDRDLEQLFADPAPVRVAEGGQGRTPPIGVAEGGQGRTPVDGLSSAEYRGRQIWSGRFDPLQVRTDAERFQYKADGDADGVTGRLRGIERWDATASGKVILFEDADRQLYVADGHQRRGLAVRLAEQGWEDARLDGYLFRAADGWSAREVRIVAALKNIREGSGQVLDAAKVFREAPSALNDRSLPVSGEFIQQARQLAALDDAAFRAVVNGVIPQRYGAVIGELAADRPELQADLVELVRRGEPGSVDGARALIQEAMLDDFIATEGVQMDLFGGLPREATVIARGRIRESVMSQLRRDERLFGQLVRNADAIEAGGNALARSDNEARLALDRAAHELVSKLSLRSGEMGDAFQAAAAAVTKGETTAAKAAKGLVARIRNAVAQGQDLADFRAESLTPDPPGAAARAAAAEFDEVGGAGQRGQMIDKPEDVEVEAEAQAAGLFDDLPEDVPEERAFKALSVCAPGRGGA